MFRAFLTGILFGRLFLSCPVECQLLERNPMPSIRTANQSQMRISGGLTVEIHYDDRCRNGHNTFSLTGRTYREAGCIHDRIVAAFPDLEPYMK